MPVGRRRWRYREFAHAWPPVGLADAVLVRHQVYPAAVLYQRVVSTASNPGPVVGGLEVDVSDALAQDCGQWKLHQGSRPNGDVR